VYRSLPIEWQTARSAETNRKGMDMSEGAQLSVTDMRRSVRHPVDSAVIAEHRQQGDLHLHISNLSQQGFMAEGVFELGRGERIIIRLPIIGRIEAYLAWAFDGRAGFQFERIIRLDVLTALIDQLQPNQRLRPHDRNRSERGKEN
jgi:hypothetical protein